MPRPATTIPNTPVARRQRIAEILNGGSVKSQGQLEVRLAADGLDVTQATLSRDLEELGAVKIRDESGALVYSVPSALDRRIPFGSEAQESRMARLAEELMISAEASANLVVLRTPPGAAQFLASALDTTSLDEVIGTIAGDDTVLVVTRDANGGPPFAARMKSLAEGTFRK